MKTTTATAPAAFDCAELAELAGRLAALSHPARIAILRHLAGREACCCKDIVERVDLAQSTVSQHLKILVEAGLVSYRPERPRSRYTVDRAALVGLGRSFEGLLSDCCAGEPPAPRVGRGN